MQHNFYSDAYLKEVLEGTRRIAVVGASNKLHRASYSVMSYMQSLGYHVIPVNPQYVGQLILGETVVEHLADIDGQIDMVDIFRNSEAAGLVSDDAIAVGAKTIWMQIGVRNDSAAKRAEAAGLKVIMDRCPKIEIPRLFRQGEKG